MQSPLTPWSPDKKHSDRERWICIYPAYLNSKKRIAAGRRVPKEKAIENPTFQEIRDVLAAGSFKFGVENKQYSRERSREIMFRGRIRVQLKDDEGQPLNPEFQTRESIMLHLCNLIPKLKTRQNKQSTEQVASGSQTASTSSKKKNKGRR